MTKKTARLLKALRAHGRLENRQERKHKHGLGKGGGEGGVPPQRAEGMMQASGWSVTWSV